MTLRQAQGRPELRQRGIERRAAVPFAVASGIALLVYLLRLDPVAGLLVDDAWYIVLAKSIAGGHGYRLISSAAAQILPAVPPGFPALLAPIVAAVPRFPDHVLWMKLLSIAAIFTAGVICWLDFVRHRGIPAGEATLIVLASLLTPALVFLATSAVMAEGVFMLLQIAAVVAVERITRRDPADSRASIVAGVLLGAAMLVRSAAAALIAAAVVYLVLKRRPRQAATCVMTVVACLLPWWLYASAHAPTDAERASHGGAMAFTYSQLLASGSLSDPTRAVSATALLERGVDNVRVVLTSDVGALIVPAMYRGPGESGKEVLAIGRSGLGHMGITTGTMLISAILTLIIAIGWLTSPQERWGMPGLLLAATLPMVAPVGGQTFRYFVPLAPFLIMLMWRGLRQARAARMALLIVIGLHGLDHAGYIHQKYTATPEWIADWRDNDQLLTWVAQNIPGDQGIATTNPGLIYLATGRRTVAIDNMQQNWDRWRAEGIRYLAATQPNSDLPSKTLSWRQRFRTDQRRLWVVEITSK